MKTLLEKVISRTVLQLAIASVAVLGLAGIASADDFDVDDYGGYRTWDNGASSTSWLDGNNWDNGDYLTQVLNAGVHEVLDSGGNVVVAGVPANYSLPGVTDLTGTIDNTVPVNIPVTGNVGFQNRDYAWLFSNTLADQDPRLATRDRKPRTFKGYSPANS